jgi:hypothetical protein
MYSCHQTLYDVATPILWKEFFLFCFDFGWFLHGLDKISQERVSIITQHIEYLNVHIRSHSVDSDENAIRLDQFLRILRYSPYLNCLNLTKDSYESYDTAYQQIPYYFQHLTTLKLENISTELFFFCYCPELPPTHLLGLDIVWIIEICRMACISQGLPFEKTSNQGLEIGSGWECTIDHAKDFTN